MTNEYIKVFDRDSKEYEKLKLAADIMSFDTGISHYVGDTYFDFGQDWKWTTILAKDITWGAYQALCPRQQEMILNADSTDDIIAGIRWRYEG